jgi:hypothetical protein
VLSLSRIPKTANTSFVQYRVLSSVSVAGCPSLGGHNSSRNCCRKGESKQSGATGQWHSWTGHLPRLAEPSVSRWWL